MRWPGFFILVYISVAVDAGLRWHLRIGGAMPDLVLPAVLFIALAAPRHAALIGCLILGLARDLAMSTAPLGLYGLSYGLVALAITGIRDVFDPRHPVARLILALSGSLMVVMIVYIQSLIHRPALSFWMMLKEVLYSGLAATAGLWLLARMRRFFVADGHRRR